MWHPVRYVAEVKGLNASSLEGFAIANFDKYGIVTEFGYCEVSTGNVDKLVKDFENRNKVADV